MEKRRKVQPLFVRLLCVFIGIVTIFFLTGLGIYNWGINTIRSQFISGVCIQNRNFTDDMNNELKRITMLQYELSENWDLMRISTPLEAYYSDYEKSNMLLHIKEKLNAIKTSSRFVDDIYVVIPQIQKTVRTLNVSDISEEAQWLLENYPDMERRQLLYRNGEVLVLAEYPFMFHTRGLPPYYLIYSTISQQCLMDFLDEMTLYNQGNGFLLSQSRSMLISNGSPELTEKISLAIKNQPAVQAMSGDSPIKNTYTAHPVIDGERYIVIYTDTGVQELSLVRYIAERDAFAGLAPYRTMILVFGLVTILLVLVFTRSLYATIHSPLKKLVTAFEQLQGGDFTAAINDKRVDEFKYIYDGFNSMVKQLDGLIDQVYKQRLLAERAKLKQLQSQINPHFLYNSFLILSNRIRLGDNVFAAEFCREIGSYFMFITRSGKDFVSLKFEVNHAVTYANIQRARFADRIQVEFEPLPEQYNELLVPRLILQPILENTFEHTLENMESGGLVRMSFGRADEFVDIIIEDNGQELTDQKLAAMQARMEDEDAEATGIINIHRRLKLVSPAGCGLLLSRSALGGLAATVRISPDGCETISSEEV